MSKSGSGDVYPIPPGNGTRPKDLKLRWFEQADRMLRGLWWVEQLALAEEIDPDFVSEIKEALLGAVEVIEERERREARRVRIEQLERVDGRTPEEAELYRAKAREMRRR